MTEPFNSTEKMPVLFLGHGSPMNAIEENEFVAGIRSIGGTIPKPAGNFMRVGSLGNKRDFCDCNGKTSDYSRLWRISKSVV